MCGGQAGGQAGRQAHNARMHMSQHAQQGTWNMPWIEQMPGLAAGTTVLAIRCEV